MQSDSGVGGGGDDGGELTARRQDGHQDQRGHALQVAVHRRGLSPSSLISSARLATGLSDYVTTG